MTTTTTEMIVESLKAHRGSVAKAADSIGVSRQAIYHHINSDPEIADALKRVRADLKRKKKPIVETLQAIRFKDGEIAMAVREKNVSARTAARALVIDRVRTETGRSEREFLAEIKLSPKAARVFEDLLPPIDCSRSEEARETMNTSLTQKQLTWIRSQPDGTVAKLLAATGIFPEASDTTEPKTQTTFSVRAVDAARLRAVSAERGETTQTLIRQVIEVARREAASARARR